MSVYDAGMMLRCRVFPCRRGVVAGTSWCSIHWNDLVGRLCDSVKDISDEAQRIYVGRTNHPERRLLQHASRRREHRDERAQYGAAGPRNYLAVLYWSGSWREIGQLERELIAAFERLEKRVNRDEDSRGEWSGNWNAVYVSWAFKGTGTDWDARHEVRSVRHLDWPIVYPTAALDPIVLKADMTPDDAAALVDGFWSRRKEERR